MDNDNLHGDQRRRSLAELAQPECVNSPFVQSPEELSMMIGDATGTLLQSLFALNSVRREFVKRDNKIPRDRWLQLLDATAQVHRMAIALAANAHEHCDIDGGDDVPAGAGPAVPTLEERAAAEADRLAKEGWRQQAAETARKKKTFTDFQAEAD